MFKHFCKHCSYELNSLIQPNMYVACRACTLLLFIIRESQQPKHISQIQDHRPAPSNCPKHLSQKGERDGDDDRASFSPVGYTPRSPSVGNRAAPRETNGIRLQEADPWSEAGGLRLFGNLAARTRPPDQNPASRIRLGC